MASCDISLHTYMYIWLTHWGRVTHICVGKLTIIGSDNGLSPGWRQAIIWTNVGILLIEPLGTNFSEILIGIQIFQFTKMQLKMSSAKWRPFCLGLNVLMNWKVHHVCCFKKKSSSYFLYTSTSIYIQCEVSVGIDNCGCLKFFLKFEIIWQN